HLLLVAPGEPAGDIAPIGGTGMFGQSSVTQPRFGEVVGCDATVLRDRSGGPRETHGGNLARVACAGYSTRRDDLSVQGGVRAVVGEVASRPASRCSPPQLRYGQ